MARQFRLYVLMINLKLAFRTLFKTPFVTFVAIVSLALGIGANAAIFSLFNQMLLRPLPVPEPARLVNLGAPGPKQGSHVVQQRGRLRRGLQLPDVPRSRARADGLHRHRRARPVRREPRVRGPDAERRGLLVSGSYFPVLGLQPALGRLLGRATTRQSASRPSSS